jgi:hypothetical protein
MDREALMSAYKLPWKGEAMRGKSIMYAAAFTLVAVLTTTILIAATYKLDWKFESFANDLDALTDEIVDMVGDNPNQARLVAAQIILDAKKASLKQRLEELKTAGGWRVSGRTLPQFQAGITDDGAKISQLLDSPALRQAARQDPKLRDQVKKLHADYMSIISGDQPALSVGSANTQSLPK